MRCETVFMPHVSPYACTPAVVAPPDARCVRVQIENKYLRMAVTSVYVCSPMVFGYYLMLSTTALSRNAPQEQELRVRAFFFRIALSQHAMRRHAMRQFTTGRFTPAPLLMFAAARF